MLPQQQFLGTFENENYTITKDYIDTETIQVRLYHTKFTPKEPKYTIAIVHGFGEHSTRFKQIADFYAKNNFEVLMIDLRGFGYSGGGRGNAEIRQLQNDVIAMLKTARSDLPLFLYGHSLGGLVIIKLLLDKPELQVSGCIVTSPLIGLSKGMQFDRVKKWFLLHLGDDLSDFILNSRVNPTALTKKTKHLHSIFDDRLMQPFVSVKFIKYAVEGLDSVLQRSAQFHFPIIIFHGQQDTVTSHQASKDFIYKHVRPFKQYYGFPNGYHEMQHDVQKDELLSKSLQFIKRLPDLKNFGHMSTKPILPLQPRNKPVGKIILMAIGILILLVKIYKRVGYKK